MCCLSAHADQIFAERWVRAEATVRATHVEFDDVVYQIAGHRLAVHLVDDHLLQRWGIKETGQERGSGKETQLSR